MHAHACTCMEGYWYSTTCIEGVLYHGEVLVSHHRHCSHGGGGSYCTCALTGIPPSSHGGGGEGSYTIHVHSWRGIDIPPQILLPWRGGGATVHVHSRYPTTNTELPWRGGRGATVHVHSQRGIGIPPQTLLQRGSQ